jgi:hypothetical protein
MTNKIEIRECGIGKGLFATRAIAKGELIIRFGGELLTAAEVQAMGEQQGNTLQVGKDCYINCVSPGLYTNHSCAPNAGLAHDDLLVAICDIAAGSQIQFDYSTCMSEDNWTMQCRCGSHNCRGLIEDFHYLPELLQRRYIDLGVVQNFIVAEYFERTRSAEVRRMGQVQHAMGVA